MHARFAALLATAIFVANVHWNALQSNAAPTTSPQAKSAQTNPAPAAATDDPTKKLGAFVGKWETEGAFTSGQKTHTSLECRWSPQGSNLICDQLVHMGAAGDHRQFTVYSYNSKAGNHSFTTLADPGAKPTTGGITIKGNLWTYDDSSFESNGKKTLVRVTNEFTDAKTEVFKVVTSEDDGATWKTMLQGVARKVGD
ncbi:MAG TPA: hypothetical protein VKV30_10725 [Candidatus Angelobacter sp.]|nr:hypothetical protein [Candidatus Angelobacter sp.]